MKYFMIFLYIWAVAARYSCVASPTVKPEEYQSDVKINSTSLPSSTGRPTSEISTDSNSPTVKPTLTESEAENLQSEARHGLMIRNVNAPPKYQPNVMGFAPTFFPYHDLQVAATQYRPPFLVYQPLARPVQSFSDMDTAASQSIYGSLSGYRRRRRDDALKSALDECLNYYPRYYCTAPFAEVA